MSLLRELVPILPFDIERLIVSFMGYEEHNVLNITDYKLYRGLTYEYIFSNLLYYKDEKAVIYFIDNELANNKDLFSVLPMNKLLLLIPGGEKYLPYSLVFDDLCLDLEIRHIPPILVILIINNMEKAIRHCIEVKNMIKLSNSTLVTCVNVACQMDRLDIVKYFCLLSPPKNENLVAAVKYNQLDIVKYLCSFVVIDPSYDDNKALSTILNRSSFNLSDFIQQNFPSANDGEDQSALAMICKSSFGYKDPDISSKYLEIVKYLCSFAEVRSKITSEIIEKSIKQACDEITKYLISLVKIKPTEKGNWISVARENKNHDIINYLNLIEI